MLAAAGRLTLTMDVESWLVRVEALLALEFVPVDNRIAVRAAALDGFPHRDPADRIIVATALGLGALLATARPPAAPPHRPPAAPPHRRTAAPPHRAYMP